MTKDELIEKAEAGGVEIDKRWSTARIAEAVGIDLEGANPGAAKPKPESVGEGMVRIRVLPLGAGKIHKSERGRDQNGKPVFLRADRGEHMVVQRAIGEGLEARGFAEIV